MQQDPHKAAAWHAKRRAEEERAERQAPWLGLAAAVLLPVLTVGFGAATWGRDAHSATLAILTGLACCIPSLMYLRGRETWVSAGAGALFLWVVGAFCHTMYETLGGGFVGIVAFLAALEFVGIFIFLALRSD
jgi:hypothetical protein